MDWTKTKTKIIIILLVLNIGLLYLLFYNKSSKSLYQGFDQSQDQLKERLEKFGIKVEAQIPTKQVEKSPLIVKYQEEDPEEANIKYFNGQGVIETEDHITKIYRSTEEINIINNRRFLYENFGKIKEDEKPSKEKAKAFLQERGYDTSDMVLTQESRENDLVTYHFSKKYEKKILETSYTRITMDHGSVVNIDRLWIEVIEEDPRKVEIEPAYKALFSLLENDQLKGETITNIEMCYYFNPEEQGLLEDNTKAEQGRAIPAWRVEFKSGQFVIVDNY